MADIITEANQLIQQAKSKEKCLDLAKNVERKLEDLKDASRTGNWTIAVGGVLIVGGFITAFFTAGAGIGLAGAGVVGVAAGLEAKAKAMEKAMKELKRAVDDLKECLNK